MSDAKGCSKCGGSHLGPCPVLFPLFTALSEEPERDAEAEDAEAAIIDKAERRVLLERAAIAALQGMLANPTLELDVCAEECAADAVTIARALIAELDKEEP